MSSGGGRKTILSWVEGCRLMEKQFKDRLCELENGERPKQKNKNLRKRDRSFITVRNKHKKMKYSHDEKENDKIFFARCKALMQISREDY